MYVGSSGWGNRNIGSKIVVVNNLLDRFSDHLNKTGSSRLAEAFEKYGLRNFAFVLLEPYTQAKFIKLTKQDSGMLLDRETYYITILNPTYNINLNARTSTTTPWTHEQLIAHLKIMKELNL
jgi:group I intron endonuclease